MGSVCFLNLDHTEAFKMSCLSHNRATVVSQIGQIHTHTEINLVCQVSSFRSVANKLTQGKYSGSSYLTIRNINFSRRKGCETARYSLKTRELCQDCIFLHDSPGKGLKAEKKIKE